MTLRKIILTACLALPGCHDILDPPSPGPLRWTNQRDVNAAIFFKDRYDCIKDASGQSSSFSNGAVATGRIAASKSEGQSKQAISHDVFMACMYARGYRLHPQGEFYAPPGAGVRME